MTSLQLSENHKDKFQEEVLYPNSKKQKKSANSQNIKQKFCHKQYVKMRLVYLNNCFFHFLRCMPQGQKIWML